jgi:exonuclease VII large subunit
MVVRQHALLAQGPHNRIQTALVVIPQLYKRLEQEARRGLLSRRQAVASYMMALDALSPLAILSRGYSVIQAIVRADRPAGVRRGGGGCGAGAAGRGASVVSRQ